MISCSNGKIILFQVGNSSRTAALSERLDQGSLIQARQTAVEAPSRFRTVCICEAIYDIDASLLRAHRICSDDFEGQKLPIGNVVLPDCHVSSGRWSSNAP